VRRYPSCAMRQQCCASGPDDRLQPGVVSYYYMLTVPQAARQAGRNQETIRRWIRSGRLRAQRIGTQHLIDESDLTEVITPYAATTTPPGWRTTSSGAPMPDWVSLVREIREGR